MIRQKQSAPTRRFFRYKSRNNDHIPQTRTSQAGTSPSTPKVNIKRVQTRRLVTNHTPNTPNGQTTEISSWSLTCSMAYLAHRRIIVTNPVKWIREAYMASRTSAPCLECGGLGALGLYPSYLAAKILVVRRHLQWKTHVFHEEFFRRNLHGGEIVRNIISSAKKCLDLRQSGRRAVRHPIFGHRLKGRHRKKHSGCIHMVLTNEDCQGTHGISRRHLRGLRAVANEPLFIRIPCKNPM